MKRKVAGASPVAHPNHTATLIDSAGPSGYHGRSMESTRTPVGGRLAKDMAILATATVVLLGLVLAFAYDSSSLHVTALRNALNDQILYITAARRWVDTGSLDCLVVYPATLWQTTTRNYIWVPGFGVVLALTFRVFGYGVVQAILPSLVSTVVATAAVFATGSRLLDRRAAAWACAVFLTFPATVVFSYVAMREMPVVAAIACALAAFVHLPERLRAPAVPLLLVPAFLLREDTALLVLPLVALLLGGEKLDRRSVLRAAAALVASVLLLSLMLASPLCSGRPSTFRACMFGDFRTIYMDATAQEALHPGLGDVGHAVARKLSSNARALVSILHGDHGLFGGYCSVALLLSGPATLLAAVRGRFDREKTAFLLGSVALETVLALMLVAAYVAAGMEGTRHLLIYLPLTALVVGALIARSGAWPRRAALAALLLQLALGLATVHAELGSRRPSEVDTLVHDDTTVLAASYEIGAPYLESHYPARWSLVPANKATFRLLDDRYRVGTVIITRADGLGARDLDELGFTFSSTMVVNSHTFSIFRRR